MGMYTALHFNADLMKADDHVINTLRYMTGEGPKPDTLPAHPLFSTERWDFMLQCSSYYFQTQTHSTVYPYPSSGYGLSVTCDFKNYYGELESFLDWIMSYVQATPGEFLGYHMYEEDEKPTLIFYPGGTDV